MKRKNRIARAITFFLVFLLAEIQLTVTGSAMMKPPTRTELHHAQELVTWYNSVYSGAKNANAILKEHITITGEVNLPAGSNVNLSLGTGNVDQYELRVAKGGVLTIDNPKLWMSGAIVVEDGGKLVLTAGNLAPPPVTDASLVVVKVKKGGVLEKSDAFQLDGQGTIVDENQVTLPDPGGDTGGDTGEDTTQSGTITALEDTAFNVACLVDTPPESSVYPLSCDAEISRPDGTVVAKVALPVRWELATVDFKTPGVYTVKGSITAETLAEKQLVNPQSLTTTMTVSVCKAGGITNLIYEEKLEEQSKLYSVKMIFPAVPGCPQKSPEPTTNPGDATAIYLWKSYDNGTTWEQVVSEKINEVPDYNFLAGTTAIGAKSYLLYKVQNETRPFWLKLEVKDSVYAGFSNSIQLNPMGNNGQDNGFGSNGDDGSSGGNRGGGTQTEVERELPIVPPEVEKLPQPQQQAPIEIKKQPVQPAPATPPPTLAEAAREASKKAAAEVQRAADQLLVEQRVSMAEPMRNTSSSTTAPIVKIAVLAGISVLAMAGFVQMKRKP